MNEYYYHNGADSVGPYSAQEIMDLLKNQQITHDTLIFDEALDDWIPLFQFRFPEWSDNPNAPANSTKSAKKSDSSPHFLLRYKKTLYLTFTALCAFVFFNAVYFLFLAEDPNRYLGETGPAEPWSSHSKHSWPRMVLSNKAWFKGRPELAGACAFLFRHTDGKVYAATAKQLLGAAQGISLENFNSELVFWFLSPGAPGEKKIQVEGLGQPINTDTNNNWLILKLTQDANLSQSTALRLRSVPVAIDEKVHLVGTSHGGSNTIQNIHTGRVTSRSRDRFRFNIQPAADLTDFNGAPILDVKGLVVGIMIMGSDAGQKGTMRLEAGGEDALSALSLMQ